MLEDYVLVTEAAEELHISRWGVLKAIERGQLAAEKRGPIYLIERTELDRFKALDRKRGRKPHSH